MKQICNEIKKEDIKCNEIKKEDIKYKCNKQCHILTYHI